jgi:hypothetical protein
VHAETVKHQLRRLIRRLKWRIANLRLSPAERRRERAINDMLKYEWKEHERRKKLR